MCEEHGKGGKRFVNMQEALELLRNGQVAAGGSELHGFMHRFAQEAMEITGELNSGYHEPEEVRRLFSKLTGKSVPDSFT